MYTVIVRHGNKFSEDYLKLWRNMVPDVVCIGDDISFKYNWVGWYALYEMFAPDFKYRPCLYFDLDTYILGSIDHLYIPPKELMLITDFYQTRRENSGVMALPENVDHIWQAVKTLPNGSSPPGNVLNELPHGNLSKQFPNQIISYKAHNCYDKRPDAPVMCFHGKPKPHETEGWAKRFWLHNT